jgi:NhaP-type Na+/H+ or K+/H+ antiporter
VEHALLSLSAIIVLGIFSQWLGWRLGVPSILVLLLLGITAGPVTGFIQPDQLLGPLLFPVVSLAVAVILFEGGLSLSLKEFRAVGGVVLRLVTIGAFTSFVLVAGAARLLMDFSWELSVLLGAVLVVTGPTVIIPMLRQIRPTGQVGRILKWEGIVIDPLGAILAVLVFQAMLYKGNAPTAEIALGLLKTVLVGAAFGLAAAFAMVLLIKRDLVPDFLQNPVALMMVVASFTAANLLQSESGLLAVTVMGFAMANQKQVSVRHIIEFKESLRVMLIAVIFMLLAAHLQPRDLANLGWGSVAFLLVLVLIVRPAAVLFSALGTRLTQAEMLFISWVAPRGIVAAAVSSIFALRLQALGMPGADKLVAITFLVIIVTVTLYGLSSRPLAKRLGLAQAHPQGVLFLGGRFWVRRIAKALQEENFPVMIVDNDMRNVVATRMEGLPASYASIFSESLLDQVEIGGIGKLLAMTSNHDANSLAAMHFAHLFGRAQIFQLAPEEQKVQVELPHHLRGHTAFSREATHSHITQLFLDEWEVKKTRLSKEFDFEAFQSQYEGKVLPLFLIPEPGRLQVFADDSQLKPQAGQLLVSLVKVRKAALPPAP